MSAPKTLIAVHVPKTAGTSFRQALETGFGDTLRLDYADRPLTHLPSARRWAALGHGLRCAGHSLPERCVYGHFLPLKYRWVRHAEFAIWLRHPVERVISRYRHYLRDVGAGDTAHAANGLLPGLSLEEFARLPHYQNTVAEYLWGFSLSKFSFVGLTEHYAEDVQRFSQRYLDGRVLPVSHANVSDAEGPEVSAAVRTLIAECNARDVALHECARRMRQAALGSAP